MDVKLFAASGSNSSQRVEWALNYKQVSYQRHEVTSADLASSYLSINPFGYVPCLTVDGHAYFESMAILEYIEEAFPGDSLLGESTRERARVRFVCEFVNSSIHSPQNRTVLKFLRPELTEAEKRDLRGEWISRCLGKLSEHLFLDSAYAISTRFTLADIFVACIYKKALQHGCSESSMYQNHLNMLRQNSRIARAEPAC
ncbi:glutathione S-transferase family protein [Vibrio coralliilyticus]|uniref:glutathione S-transferase family protein n=1 Tax=Vibrio coralliilyticus TaxID=190893 RepID=UPI00156194F6|nr:glutathione S-transferase family protein [Vibrio coralliilyticus]NRF29554.1 glutathione S-transferase family protein [Vibrio coralliilyticus]NRF52294.1 glutathione S-transferase family protein [Vibrio coralliilyticus]NRG03424.1 glutathione S-transferase family protein [Vibrio coralliilyticus]